MKIALLIASLIGLAGCAAQPTTCFHNVSPSISIASNDPRIPSVTVPARVVDVCITPGYIEKTTTP